METGKTRLCQLNCRPQTSGFCDLQFYLPARACMVWSTLTMLADILPQLREAAPVIISLIIIEGLLSVDNMLAIAALASQLPEHQKRKALRLGLAGAYVFRGIALFFVGFILRNENVQYLGAAYLIYLMAQHFSEAEEEAAHKPAPHTFWATVMTIQFMDLSLSVDNVVAAVAMSPMPWVVYTGVFLGLLTLWLFSTVSLRLIEAFPILKHTAFLLIGYVGLLLAAQIHWHFDLHPVEKFIGLAVIVALSLWYARSAALQKLCKPVFCFMMVPLKLYAKIAGALITLLLWPFKAVAGLFRKAPSQQR